MTVQSVKFLFGNTTYSATAEGRVFQENGTELGYQKDGSKLRVSLKSDTKQTKVGLHRLIAICFLGASNNDEVLHKDGNGQNNSAINLELKRLDREVSKVGESITLVNEAVTEMLTVNNGFGKITVSRHDFQTVRYYKKHGYKIVS